MNSQLFTPQTPNLQIPHTKSPLFRLNRDYQQFNSPGRRSGKAAKAPSSIVIEDGKLSIRIAVENIVFAKAEHVYVGIYFSNEQRVIQRGSLAGLLIQLPEDQFMQVHRSYVINLRWVDSWTKDTVWIKGKEIPISRARCQEVLERLESRRQ